MKEETIEWEGMAMGGIICAREGCRIYCLLVVETKALGAVVARVN